MLRSPARTLEKRVPEERPVTQDLPVDDFRAALVEWLDADEAPDARDTAAWSRRLGDVGLLAPAWPIAHGGRALDADRVKILESALRAGRSE